MFTQEKSGLRIFLTKTLNLHREKSSIVRFSTEKIIKFVKIYTLA